MCIIFEQKKTKHVAWTVSLSAMLEAVLLSWHRPSHHCSIGLARMAGAQDLITLIHFFSPWYISTELQSDFSSAHCYLVALVWGISFRSLYSFTRYIAKIIVWYVRLIWVPHLFYIISRSLHPSYHVIFHPQQAAGCPWTFMMLWTQCSHTYDLPCTHLSRFEDKILPSI